MDVQGKPKAAPSYRTRIPKVELERQQREFEEKKLDKLRSNGLRMARLIKKWSKVKSMPRERHCLADVYMAFLALLFFMMKCTAPTAICHRVAPRWSMRSRSTPSWTRASLAPIPPSMAVSAL